MAGINIIHIFLHNIYSGLRWSYYWRFRKDYVMESLARRKGKCPDPALCNCCYHNPSLFPCKFASKEGCLAINSKYRPNRCRYYPFDEKDKSLYARRNNCRFYWEDSK